MISIYGNGSSNASIIDNVYIFEEFEYECVDGEGNPVGTITAFPGENLADRIAGSAVDKIGYFEAPELEVAPSKPSTKATSSVKSSLDDHRSLCRLCQKLLLLSRFTMSEERC